MVDAYQSRIKELIEKYQLPDCILRSADKNVSGASGTKYAFDKTFTLEDITFHVQATNEGSENTLIITPSGLSERNDVIKQKIDGMVTGAEIADLNNDGSPEIYIYVTSAGSGSYGSLVAYSATTKHHFQKFTCRRWSRTKRQPRATWGMTNSPLLSIFLPDVFLSTEKMTQTAVPRAANDNWSTIWSQVRRRGS